MTHPSLDNIEFLPTTRADMEARGWDALDVLLVSGDAYVDHPSFGVPLLGRWLERHGFRVGILPQPDWTSPDDFLRMGQPRLFCGISAGCLDSMLAHYTAFRKKRSDDAYTPGGMAGKRPNRAVTVYANLARAAFPGLPVVIGGIEASLRRFVHFDFWSDGLRRSILADSKADLLVYGMGERAILAIAQRLAAGEGLAGIPGTARLLKKDDTLPAGTRELPSFASIQAEPPLLVAAALMAEAQMQEANHALMQEAEGRRVLCECPAPPLTTEELDSLADLPFTGKAHPACQGPVPAAAMIRGSITAVRGCGGGCSFCSLALHQGRKIQSRSRESIVREVARLSSQEGWNGVITDVGGPTANAWASRCTGSPERCGRASCYAPEPCACLELHQGEYLSLLRTVRGTPGVKHVRVASGVRHDIALREPDFVEGLVGEFTGGQLKLAPEHCVDHVLSLMRKGSFERFEEFRARFDALTAAAGREYFIIPYVMSAFPGCTMEDMRALAGWFRERGWRPQQVQCFIPTPGTVASAMYFAACDPEGRPIHVAKTDRERLEQHHLLLGDTGTERAGERESTGPARRPSPPRHPAAHRGGRKR